MYSLLFYKGLFYVDLLFKQSLMLTNRIINPKMIIQFAWRLQAVCFVISGLVFVAHDFLLIKSIAIPFLPVATIGTAVAFYVGFKNNSAYDRLWEARRIWGSITNASRMWGAMVADVVASRATSPEEATAVKKELMYRHIAWLNMLRLQLRRKPVFHESWYVSSPKLQVVRDVFGDEKFEDQANDVMTKFLNATERKELERKPNVASALMKRQNEELIHLKNKGWLDEFEHSDMGKLVLEFYNQQGASERIKSFPFPRQYASFSTVFVFIFITLLPFSLIGELAKLNADINWMVIPFTMLIAWVFAVMEQIGDASENPFDNGINDIPMTAICRNIEIELREMLGEKELPARIEPVKGILM
jgi:ion channel-forming bestrophin family protein